MLASISQHYIFRIFTFAFLAFLLYFVCSSIPTTLALYEKDQTFLILPAAVMVLSWYFVRLERKTLHYLGLELNLRQIKLFLSGLLIGLAAYGVVVLLVAVYANPAFQINDHLVFIPFFSGIIFLLSSAVFEELMFRGYILKKLTESIGIVKALMVTGLLFGVYHWLAWGILGNWQLMILSLITTGIGHLIFATALLRSGSLYLSISIHYAWNVSNEYLWFYKNDASSITPNALFILTGEQLPQVYFTLIYIAVGLATIFALRAFNFKKY